MTSPSVCPCCGSEPLVEKGKWTLLWWASCASHFRMEIGKKCWSAISGEGATETVAIVDWNRKAKKEADKREELGLGVKR